MYIEINKPISTLQLQTEFDSIKGEYKRDETKHETSISPYGDIKYKHYNTNDRSFFGIHVSITCIKFYFKPNENTNTPAINMINNEAIKKLSKVKGHDDFISDIMAFIVSSYEINTKHKEEDNQMSKLQSGFDLIEYKSNECDFSSLTSIKDDLLLHGGIIIERGYNLHGCEILSLRQVVTDKGNDSFFNFYPLDNPGEIIKMCSNEAIKELSTIRGHDELVKDIIKFISSHVDLSSTEDKIKDKQMEQLQKEFDLLRGTYKEYRSKSGRGFLGSSIYFYTPCQLNPDGTERNDVIVHFEVTAIEIDNSFLFKFPPIDYPSIEVHRDEVIEELSKINGHDELVKDIISFINSYIDSSDEDKEMVQAQAQKQIQSCFDLIRETYKDHHIDYEGRLSYSSYDKIYKYYNGSCSGINKRILDVCINSVSKDISIEFDKGFFIFDDSVMIEILLNVHGFESLIKDVLSFISHNTIKSKQSEYKANDNQVSHYEIISHLPNNVVAEIYANNHQWLSNPERVAFYYDNDLVTEYITSDETAGFNVVYKKDILE